MKNIVTFSFAIVIASFVTTAYSQNIYTVAGNGTAAFCCDDSLATRAAIWSPTGIAFNKMFTLYIADVGAGENKIRKVDTSGIITSLAGNGSIGYGGDNSAATGATLNYPAGVAVDDSGNVYIADTDNSRIRKVNHTTGIITTIAGNGTSGFGGDGTAATGAQLYYPSGVAVDHLGNVYVADYDNQRIRKINAAGIISTVAGNGTAGFGGDGTAASNAVLNYPIGVAVDDSNNLYIADYGNNRIRKINSLGIINTIAGNGNAAYSGDNNAAVNASLNYPAGVCIDSAGNVYIADLKNNVVRKINTAGIISTFAGKGVAGFSGDSGLATLAELHYPAAVAVGPKQQIYIADYGNNRVRKVVTIRQVAVPAIAANSEASAIIDISPNPASDFIKVSILSKASNISVRLLNLLGTTMVYKEGLSNACISLTTRDLPNGTYLLKVQLDGINYSSKVIIMGH
jgi:sugar lactone lactonase YvrE